MAKSTSFELHELVQIHDPFPVSDDKPFHRQFAVIVKLPNDGTAQVHLLSGRMGALTHKDVLERRNYDDMDNYHRYWFSLRELRHLKPRQFMPPGLADCPPFYCT